MADSTHPRLLFRYLGGEEWNEYREILRVFTGTFFAEFTPDEVVDRLATAGVEIDGDVVPMRLESLRGWGNLTVSSSVGQPASLDDYYRRRNRYLITRGGQEAFEFVEGLMATVDQIGDVQLGRMRDLLAALEAVERGDDLTDSVRRVFELHESFTTEITQFFAELNLWQSRYDLTADEVQFFANVLVNYVAEQLHEIEQSMRPIGRVIERVRVRLPELLPQLHAGLAARVDQAGLGDQVSVRRLAGASESDWDHLAGWFVATDDRPARLEVITRQAFAAVRALTANLTRLSRESLGAASRRADFARLAGIFHSAESAERAHDLASAAFGLGSCRHLGRVADDHADPTSSITAWRDAPRAAIPVSLRARGEISQRGRTTPIRDRATERDRLRRARELERVEIDRIRSELLEAANNDGELDGVELSIAAFRALRDAMGRSRTGGSADGFTCELRRHSGSSRIRCDDGELTLKDLVVAVS